MAGGAPKTVAAVLTGTAVAHRIAYVLSAPSSDPAFSRPGLDAAYYLDWARSLAEGGRSPEGAFYLAPLYPHLLAAFFRLFGGESLLGVLLLQQAAVLVAGGLLGAIALRRRGPWAGIAAAALVWFYQPVLFFASRPVGEATGLLLLALAVWAAGRASPRSAFGAGAACGLAALARPNLLLVFIAWGTLEAWKRRLLRAALVVAGVSIVVFPVALRNVGASGHWVPISSNSGLTLYHGNGPGALGIYNPPDGFSGDLALQREEATRLARARTGLDLDPVEADRFWGREALRARLSDPWDTLRLGVRRILLLADSYEHGLDDPPMLDPNPWRLTLRVPFPQRREPGAVTTEIPIVPFGLLVGLALAGVHLRGFAGTGGAHLWSSALACAATPLLFYASSRYRLPLAALLAVPAGVGCVELLSHSGSRQRRAVAAVLAGGCALLSFLVPFHDLRRAEEAAALANRAAAYHEAGDEEAAEREARRAVATDPESTGARFALGLALQRSGHAREAEKEYREVLRFDAGHAEAAGNLGGLLVRRGAPEDAIPILRKALALRPGHAACWTNLVVALAAQGDLAAARAAASEAMREGVRLDPELIRTIEGGTGR